MPWVATHPILAERCRPPPPPPPPRLLPTPALSVASAITAAGFAEAGWPMLRSLTLSRVKSLGLLRSGFLQCTQLRELTLRHSTAGLSWARAPTEPEESWVGPAAAVSRRAVALTLE